MTGRGLAALAGLFALASAGCGAAAAAPESEGDDVGLAIELALGGVVPPVASPSGPAVDYEWPVVEVIDGATLVVDAGADFPPGLALLTVRVAGLGGGGRVQRNEGDWVSRTLAAASKVVIRNPRYGDADCECQVVADVLVDGESLVLLALVRSVTRSRLPMLPDPPERAPADGGGGASAGDCVARLKENTAALEGEVPRPGGRFGVIGTWEACELADLTGAMLDAKRRGDEAALGALKERFAALERAREERDRQLIEWALGEGPMPGR